MYNLRSVLAHGRHQLAFWYRTPWRWRGALEEEETHWDKYLSEIVNKQAGRLDPDSELQSHIKELIRDIGPKARILDVGAGPLTVLGKCWDGHKLDITATDPLAAQYDSLLAKYGITPPVRTIKCDGERLVELFGESQYDLAYAKNSLDHSYDPLKVIRQMAAVTRPGGLVALEHLRNEAEHEHYLGLHQWNLDLQDGLFVIWNRNQRIDVAAAVRPQATVIQASR
ncbi:MAG: class I SAM-dependent methyltransferase [Omnitrophica WOR_2 bacterium]